MSKVPVVYAQTSFTTTATFTPETYGGTQQPMPYIPMRFGLQVSGMIGAAKGTLTSWTVIVQGSLDGVYFNDMSTPLLQHINTSNANGDVVWGGSNYYPIRYFKIHCSALVLNTATSILVTFLGIE